MDKNDPLFLRSLKLAKQTHPRLVIQKLVDRNEAREENERRHVATFHCPHCNVPTRVNTKVEWEELQQKAADASDIEDDQILTYQPT